MPPDAPTGFDGPVVVVPARVARRLAGPLGDLIRRAHAAGERIDPEVAATVAALERAGREWAARLSEPPPASANGTRVPAAPTVGATMRPMTTGDVAQQLGCSVRAARALAEREAIAARRHGRAWVFDPVDVAEYRRRRAS